MFTHLPPLPHLCVSWAHSLKSLIVTLLHFTCQLTYTTSINPSRNQSPFTHWITSKRFVHVHTLLTTSTVMGSTFALVNVHTPAKIKIILSTSQAFGFRAFWREKRGYFGCKRGWKLDNTNLTTCKRNCQ